MATRLTFDAMVRDFVDDRFMDVECPEYLDGDDKPTVVRFRTKLNVVDFVWFLDHEGSSPELERANLYYLLAVDENGEPLVPRDGEQRYVQWREKVEVGKVSSIVLRAGLEAKIYDQMVNRDRVEMETEGKGSLGGIRPAGALSRAVQLRDLLGSVVQSPDSPLREDGSPPQYDDGPSPTSTTS